jgi:hypothetical protein
MVKSVRERPRSREGIRRRRVWVRRRGYRTCLLSDELQRERHVLTNRC